MNKIFIDAGHGGKDPGAVCNGYRESDINLQISLYIKEVLKRHKVDVIMSRLNDTFESLEYRVHKANDKKCDAFISIHCNSFSNNTAKGFEVWGYDKNKLVDSIHKGFKDNKDIWTADRGKKYSKENYYVLRKTKMKAVIVECGFISNDSDRGKLIDMQKEMATAISKGVLEYLGVGYIEEVAEDVQSNFKYIVSAGAFNNRKNAENLISQLEVQGFKPYLHICK